MTPKAAPDSTVRVVLEVGAKRTFASALDWPGWSRSGKDEGAALDSLAEHAQRYAAVARAAGVRLPGGDLVVVERVPGDATTDFGAPSRPAPEESAPLTAAAARRVTALLGGAWRVFDAVVAAAPVALRKGPRGGGRDRDAIVDHVLGAEHAYARKLGVQLAQPSRDDDEAIEAKRAAIIATLAAGMTGAVLAEQRWIPRYAARRIAWHVVDHAWEIENRTER